MYTPENLTGNGILKSIFNNPHFAIYRLSSKGELLFANNTFYRMLGVKSFEEIISLCEHSEWFRNNFHPKKYQEHLFKINHNDGLETRWKTASGRSIEVVEYVQKINENDKVFFYDCIAEDITEKKIIDELIGEVIERDYAIIKTLPDILFMLTKDGTITNCKIGSDVEFVRSQDYMIGKRITDIFPDEIAKELLEHINDAHYSQKLISYNFILKNSENEKHYEARIVKSNKQEVLMLIRDITIQKKNEQQIVKIAEDLKQINKTKDKFVSIIAHDVRAPIIALIGYAEILAEDIEELQINEIKEFSSNIVEISKQTITLLTNLLEWSRIQTGRLDFNPTTLDSYNLVQNTITLLKASASNKNITIKNHIEKNTLIYADENMMQSVFNNLVNNAIKFSNLNGTITLSCEKVDEMIRFSVKDNGVGMDKDQIAMIFDFNKSITTPGTIKEKGTGLGLILCKEFVEKHSGKLWVNSTLNNGTEFFFSIPEVKEAELNEEFESVKLHSSGKNFLLSATLRQ